MPATGKQPQQSSPPAPPALAEVRSAWERTRAAMATAGTTSLTEYATDAAAPSEQAREAWADVATALSEMLAGVMHLADGGDYAATAVTGNAADVEHASTASTPSTDTQQPQTPRRRGNGAAARRTTRPEPQHTVEFDPVVELDDFLAALAKLAERDGSDAPTREQAEAALAEWHAAVQVEGEPVRFSSNEGRTAILAHDWLVSRYRSMPAPEPLASEAVWALTHGHDGSILRVLSWTNPDQAPHEGQAVTETDVHAQYLAAAGAAALGDGEPEELTFEGGRYLDEDLSRCPGYVRLAAQPDLDDLPGHVRGAFRQLYHDWWLPTPLAHYLIHDHPARLRIDEAVLWRSRPGKSGRPQKAYGQRLKRWADTVKDGRTALLHRRDVDGSQAAGLALDILKSAYSTFLGGLLRSEEFNDTGTLRPDWSDQVVGLASANALRALDKAHDAGWSPLGGIKDAVWWLSEHAPVEPGGLTLSDQPGKWHITRHGHVNADLVQAYHTGQPNRIRKAIIAADNKRQEG